MKPTILFILCLFLCVNGAIAADEVILPTVDRFMSVDEPDAANNSMQKIDNRDINKHSINSLESFFYRHSSSHIFFNETNSYNLFVRGMGHNRTTFQIDDIDISNPFNRGTDFSLLHLIPLQSLSISHGGSSFINSMSYLGSTINMYSKEPVDKQTVQLNVQGGNLNNSLNIFYSGTGLNNSLYWLMNANYSTMNDFNISENNSIDYQLTNKTRTHVQTTSTVGLFKFGIRNEQTNAFISVMINEKSREIPNRLPNANPNKFSKEDENKSILSNFKLESKLSDRLDMKSNIYYLYHKYNINSYENIRYLKRIWIPEKYQYLLSHSWGINTCFTWDLEDFPPLEFSIKYKRNINDRYKLKDTIQDNRIKFKDETETLFFAAEQHYYINHSLEFTAGLFYSTTNFIFSNYRKSKPKYSNYGIRTGVKFYVIDGLALFTQFHLKNRPPSIYEMTVSRHTANADIQILDNENKNSLELGVKYSNSRGQIRGSFVYYTLKNYLNQINVDNKKIVINDGQYDYQGLELYGEYDFKYFIATLSYAYTNPLHSSLVSKNDVIEFIPKQRLFFSVYAEIYDLFNIIYQYSYIAERSQYIENKTLYTMNAYSNHNIELNTALLNIFTFYVRLNNLSDEAAESIQGFPMPGRNFYTGIQIKL